MKFPSFDASLDDSWVGGIMIICWIHVIGIILFLLDLFRNLLVIKSPDYVKVRPDVN